MLGRNMSGLKPDVLSPFPVTGRVYHLTQSSDELESLLKSIVIPDSFDARDLPTLFHQAVSHLEASGIPYVVVGRLALARYRRAQCTNAIPLVLPSHLLPADRTRLTSILNDIVKASRSKTSTVELTVNFSHSPLEDQSVAATTLKPWLGISARIAEPEYLLFYALRSANIDDAIRLIGGDGAHMKNARALTHILEPQLSRTLEETIKRAEEEARSSYSDRMATRIASSSKNRKSRGAP